MPIFHLTKIWLILLQKNVLKMFITSTPLKLLNKIYGQVRKKTNVISVKLNSANLPYSKQSSDSLSHDTFHSSSSNATFVDCHLSQILFYFIFLLHFYLLNTYFCILPCCLLALLVTLFYFSLSVCLSVCLSV